MFAFDLMHRDGADLTGQLASAANGSSGCSSPTRAACTWLAASTTVRRCSLRPSGTGWRGIVSKRKRRPIAQGYLRDWVKTKTAAWLRRTGAMANV